MGTRLSKFVKEYRQSQCDPHFLQTVHVEAFYNDYRKIANSTETEIPTILQKVSCDLASVLVK
jgi:hypothetical protein